MTVLVLDVHVLFGAVEQRRGLLGLSLEQVAAQARVPFAALDAMAAGVAPSELDAGLLLLWLGWEPVMARYVVGDAA